LNQSDEKWLPWFTFLGAMVSVTPYIDTEFSISDWIRSWALEELLKLANPTNNGVLGLVLELKNSGWRFIGDEIQLEQFVMRRLGTVTIDRKSFQVGRKCLDPALLDPLPWKLVKKTGIEGVQASEDKVIWWVGSRLSLHFLCLSCLMMAVIREAFSTEILDDESIDQLVSRSLGIPKDWTFSSFFLKIWGIRRVQIYIAQNWPELASAMFSLPNANPKFSM
jgi:hypothetical protein